MSVTWRVPAIFHGNCQHKQWPIQNFTDGEVHQPPRCGRLPIIWQNFLETCMKLKEIGMCPWRNPHPLDPPMTAENRNLWTFIQQDDLTKFLLGQINRTNFQRHHSYSPLSNVGCPSAQTKPKFRLSWMNNFSNLRNPI